MIKSKKNNQKLVLMRSKFNQQVVYAQTQILITQWTFIQIKARMALHKMLKAVKNKTTFIIVSIPKHKEVTKLFTKKQNKKQVNNLKVEQELKQLSYNQKTK